MSANVQPIYPLTPNVGTALFPTTGLTKSDGSSGVSGVGTDLSVLFTAGANGSYLEKIRAIPVATVAATATTGTVLRFYLSTVNTGVTTNANTKLLFEMGAAAQTADHSTNPIFYIEVPMNLKMATGTYILISTHLAPATNTNWQATAWGMDF